MEWMQKKSFIRIPLIEFNFNKIWMDAKNQNHLLEFL